MVSAFPQKNSKTKAEKNGVYAGGPATNAAIACAYLGGDVSLVTPIGEHPLRQFILDDIQDVGVVVNDPIAGKPGKPTFASIITDGGNGDRTVFSHHPQIKLSDLTRVDIDLDGYDYALFDGFYPESALDLARRCQERGIVTVLDGGSWKPGISALLSHIDVAICSADFKVPDVTDTATTLMYLHARDIPQVAITRGDKSIIFSEDGEKGEVPVAPVQAVDTLGAGDFFHGAFMYFFSQDKSFKSSLSKASKVAADSCLSFGTRHWMR